MKITDVKAAFPDYKHVVPSWRTNFWQIVVRVESNVGVVGFGYGGGGPQKMITAVFDQGGRIFANFSTSSSYGEKTTRVEVRAEWSSEELDS